MGSTTVKELKDMIDAEEFYIDYDEDGMCVVVVGDMQYGGFAREYHAMAWIDNLRYGLDTYDDNDDISHDSNGTGIIHRAVNIGEFRV